MVLAADIVLERRQLRKRLSLWRSFSIVALGLLLGFLFFDRGNHSTSSLFTGNHIARVSIEGTITEWREQLQLLDKIKESEKVKGVLLFVNSPGGTTTGGEALFEQIRTIAEKKPVVAQFGTIAASAGYIVGLGADHIVSRGNTITGSVGVIVQWPEVSDLLSRLGVKVNEVKSGELKATPSPFEPVDDASKAVLKEMIDDGYRWFSNLVESRRGVKLSDIPGLEKGRVFSGREALKYRLVDEIGGEKEAKQWLEDKRGITKNLQIIDWKPAPGESWGMFSSAHSFLSNIRDGSGGIMDKFITLWSVLRTSGLDGLISVWHPQRSI